MILGFVGFLLVRVCVTLGCLSTPLCGMNDKKKLVNKALRAPSQVTQNVCTGKDGKRPDLPAVTLRSRTASTLVSLMVPVVCPVSACVALLLSRVRPAVLPLVALGHLRVP